MLVWWCLYIYISLQQCVACIYMNNFIVVSSASNNDHSSNTIACIHLIKSTFRNPHGENGGVWCRLERYVHISGSSLSSHRENR